MANNKITKIVSASVLASVLVLSGCGGGEDRQAEYLERAQTFFDAENIEKATIEVKNVLQINPKNADARYLLGLIAEADKDYRVAFGNFNATLEENPNHIKALAKVASYYQMSNDLKNAEEKIALLLAADPGNADALSLKAGIQYKKAHAIRGENEDYVNDADYIAFIEQATELAQQSRTVDPGNVRAVGILTAIYSEDNPDMALSIIGDGIANQSENESLKMLKIRLLTSQDKREEVVAMYKQLMVEYPDNLLYPFQLVNYYLKDDRMEESQRQALAEATLNDLIKLKPEDETVKLWLVEFKFRNRTAEEGRLLLESFVKAHPESFTFTDRLAGIYIQGKEIDKAERLYTQMIDLDPTGSVAIEARTRLMRIALSNQRREDAEKILAEIFDLEPENAEALKARARLNISDNKLEAAIPDLRVVLKNDPESIAALAMLGGIHEKNNSPDLALDSYQRLLSLKPGNLTALLGASRVLLAKNQAEEAQPLLEAAIKVNASHVEAVRLLTDIYSREQRWDDALSVVSKLTENDKTMAMGYYLQGRIYLRKQDFKEAVVVLKKSHDLEPRGVETLSALVSAYLALEQANKAMDYVLAHVKKYPEQVHARELLARLYMQSRDLKLAATTLRGIVNDHPQRNSAYQLLTKVYIAQSKVDEIEGLYLSGLEQAPDNTALRLMLAEYYQAKGKNQLAVNEYESILKIIPDSLVIKNNLASLLLDYFNTPENLLRVTALAEELGATEAPAFLDTAGWVQYQLGNYAQAVSLLAAAEANGGKGAVYHYHLGMAYYKSDMKAQAKEQLELALADEKAKFAGRDEAKSTLALL